MPGLSHASIPTTSRVRSSARGWRRLPRWSDAPRWAKKKPPASPGGPSSTWGAENLLGALRLGGGLLHRGDVLLDGLLDRVVELLVDRDGVVVGGLRGGDRRLHVADDGLGAGRRVLERLFHRGEGDLVDLGGLLLEHALHLVARFRGGGVGAARERVGALHRRLDRGGVDGKHFLDVTRAGERLGVLGRELERVTRGTEGELGELLG